MSLLEQLILETPKDEIFLFDWTSLTKNPNVSVEFIENNKHYPWNLNVLTNNKTLTLDLVKREPGISWDWFIVSSMPNITWEMIMENKTLPWNWFGISYNPNLDIKYLEENKNSSKWDWFGLGKNPAVPLSFIERNIDKFYFETVSDHPHLTIKFIRKYIKKNWNWFELTKNPAITLEMITNNPDLPWKLDMLSFNPNVTKEFVFENKNKINWYFKSLTKNKNIKLEDVLTNKEFYSPIMNPNITLSYIRKNKDALFTLSGISRNNLNEYYLTLNYYHLRKNNTMKQTKKLKKQLLKKTWKPERIFNWCLDTNEIMEIKKNFNY